MTAATKINTTTRTQEDRMTTKPLSAQEQALAAPEPPETVTVRCLDCGGEHQATFHHYSQWNNHEPIWAVTLVCTPEWFTDFYTAEMIVKIDTTAQEN